jgi:hypothetical protein
VPQNIKFDVSIMHLALSYFWSSCAQTLTRGATDEERYA